MSKITPPEWIKNRHRKEPYFMDGDEFVVAIRVRNNKTSALYWDIYKIRAHADERLDWYNSETDESWDAWEWSDVDYYIPINADGPMTKKQMEAYL